MICLSIWISILPKLFSLEYSSISTAVRNTAIFDTQNSQSIEFLKKPFCRTTIVVYFGFFLNKNSNLNNNWLFVKLNSFPKHNYVETWIPLNDLLYTTIFFSLIHGLYIQCTRYITLHIGISFSTQCRNTREEEAVVSWKWGRVTQKKRTIESNSKTGNKCLRHVGCDFAVARSHNQFRFKAWRNRNFFIIIR